MKPQERWQRRKQRAGMCRTCGKRKRRYITVAGRRRRAVNCRKCNERTKR